MAKMTKLQRNYIKDIEKNLNVKYRGRDNRHDASDFINIHKEENRKFTLKNKAILPPTGKQLRLIRAIEDTLGIEFKGKTLKQAKNYISKYYYDFKANQSNLSKVKHYFDRRSEGIDKIQKAKRRKARA